MGALLLLREAQLPGVRPDFVASHDGHLCGWIELKAPGHSVDGSTWRGREKKQWQLLSALDALIVANGRQAVLYQLGEPLGRAELPFDDVHLWDPQPLVTLLRQFVAARPPVISRVSQLAQRLAPLTRMLRDRLAAGLKRETPVTAVRAAKQVWARHVHEGVTDPGFADDLAQVVGYSLAIAGLRGGADADGDNTITLAEAQQAIRGSNPALAASIGPVLGVPGLLDAIRAEVAAIERLVSAIDPVRVARSKDARGEPWLWFYEDFLAAYDPAARKAAGVYYTPTAVVRAQVRLIDSVLRDQLGRRFGFGDSSVVTLDPATGSGTYPLAVLERAGEVAHAIRGEAGPAQVAAHLTRNVRAFEILPGPYAVAHLRIGQVLAEMAGTLLPPDQVRVS